MEFRPKALSSLRSPDELDTAVRLTGARAWLVVLAFLVVVGLGATWAFAGEVPRSVSAPGILTHPLGVSAVQSTVSGLVSKVFPQTGSVVVAGTPIATLVTGDGQTQVVRVPFSGQVTNVLVTSGQYVTVGTTVILVERTDDPHDRLLAMLYAEADKAAFIRPGDQVDLEVSAAPSAAFGVLRGTVTAVGQFSQTRRQVAGFLGNDQLAGKFSAAGSPIAVMVDLSIDPRTVSGLKWSTGTGPPYRIDSQVEVTALVHLPSQRPIDWVLPS